MVNPNDLYEPQVKFIGIDAKGTMTFKVTMDLIYSHRKFDQDLFFEKMYELYDTTGEPITQELIDEATKICKDCFYFA